MAKVTLFIEDAAIKLLEARGRQVKKWAKLPLEPGLVSDGVILDEDQVADKLKELLELQGVKARKVTAGLSGFNSVYRLVSLPELPLAILPEAVKREAKRVIPVSLDQVYLAYQPLSAPVGETRLFLIAFPRNAADAFIRTLHKAGLEPGIMDLAPLALCRTIDEPRAIVADVRSTSLDIAVMVDRVPQVIRSLFLPSEAQSLSERLPTIVEELNRTIAFYNSSHLENPLDSTVPILVSGDLAEAPDTWQSLAGTSGYSVSALPSPMESLEGFDPSQFMVNIGLALKELSLEKKATNFSLVNFNALPEVYRPKGIPLLKTLVPVSVVVGIGLVVFMGLLVQNTSAETATLRSDLTFIENRTTEQRDAISAVREEIKQIEAQFEPIEAQIELVEAATGIFNNTLTSLEEGRERVNRDLSRIVSLLPGTENIDLTMINHSGSPVTITGVALDETDIFQYARALRNSGRFPSVIIASIQAIEEEEEEEEEIKRFNFELLLK